MIVLFVHHIINYLFSVSLFMIYKAGEGASSRLGGRRVFGSAISKMLSSRHLLKIRENNCTL